MFGLLALLFASGALGAVIGAIIRFILVPREERRQQNLSN